MKDISFFVYMKIYINMILIKEMRGKNEFT